VQFIRREGKAATRVTLILSFSPTRNVIKMVVSYPVTALARQTLLVCCEANGMLARRWN